MVAYCQKCHNFGTFRVSNIEEVMDCDIPVPERPDFNLRAYWKEASKHLTENMPTFSIKLRVTSPMRFSLKGEYSILNEEADGSIIVRVEVESFDAAVLYVLSLGTDATVICPKRVRQAVAAKAQSIAEMYLLQSRQAGSSKDLPPALSGENYTTQNHKEPSKKCT
jgi:predicted DNA-binding transcriptional regulator YafY